MFLFFCCLVASAARSADIAVEALMPGLAVFKIDGRRVTLREGQRSGDVLLIASDAKSALVRIGDEERRLQVSQRISSAFSRPQRPEVVVQRDGQLQYRTTAEINGVRMPVIVDTGANIVALNARQAAAVGIRPEDGQVAEVQTAGAILPARRVMLESVAVGGIRVNAVTATVIDGAQPATTLLGMSFLRHVEMVERDGVLTLRGRW
ncbi:MAG: TIGR02281 family clan AA aspartic protease [Halieaceae bacterium]|jgi:aspartyl protease family protein|nr:TIGR02281 family clan AA aspartic protease [Halieaceae bacterium]